MLKLMTSFLRKGNDGLEFMSTGAREEVYYREERKEVLAQRRADAEGENGVIAGNTSIL
jgi:hypothetical protein